MNNYYPMILGIGDKINDLNEKLNGFAAEHLDNVWAGVAVLAVIVLVAFWGINTLNKR